MQIAHNGKSAQVIVECTSVHVKQPSFHNCTESCEDA